MVGGRKDIARRVAVDAHQLGIGTDEGGLFLQFAQCCVLRVLAIFHEPARESEVAVEGAPATLYHQHFPLALAFPHYGDVCRQ